MVLPSKLVVTSFLNEFQAAIFQIGTGVYPSGFKTDTIPYSITYSTSAALLDNPPLHTSLHVRHLNDSVSPIRLLSYSSEAWQPQDDRKDSASFNSQTNFTRDYISVQIAVDSATSRLPHESTPAKSVFEKIAKHLSDESEQDDLILSALMLLDLASNRNFDLIERRENIGMAVDLLRALALRSTKHDERALLNELIHAAHQSAFVYIGSEEETMRIQHWKLRLQLIDSMITGWLKALAQNHAADDHQFDVISDPLRIFAGLHACLTPPHNFDQMIKFFMYSQLLYRSYGMHEVATEDNLRMAWAKLAHADNTEEECDDIWPFVRKRILRTISAWKNDSTRRNHVAVLEEFAEGAEKILQQYGLSH